MSSCCAPLPLSSPSVYSPLPTSLRPCKLCSLQHFELNLYRGGAKDNDSRGVDGDDSMVVFIPDK